MRGGLGDREDPHLAAVLVPGPGPGQVPGQLPGGGAGALADRGEQFGEPALVVGDDGVDPPGQATEAPLVRGQHLVHVEVPRPGQRVQVVPERVGRRAPLHGDVGGDPRQHVIAGEQPARPLVHEAQVPGGVAGRVHGAELPAGHVGQLPVREQPVGPRDRGELFPLRGGADRGLGLGRRRAQIAQELRLDGHRPLRAAVVGAGEDLMVGGVHRDPRARGLPDPAGQPDVVEVHVRDQHAADVRHPGADGFQPGPQRPPGLLRAPARVDQDQAPAGAERVYRHVAQRVVRDGHGQGPQVLVELLGGRHDALQPRLALRRAGDRQLRCQRSPFVSADSRPARSLGGTGRLPEPSVLTTT